MKFPPIKINHNMKYFKTDGGRKKAFPKAKTTNDDCVIRAIAIGTKQDYKKVWTDLFSISVKTGYFPNNDNTSVAYLEKHGWKRIKFGKHMVRLRDGLIPKDKTIICHVRQHWVAMVNGTIMDTWDSRNNSMGYSQRVFSYYIKK